MGCVGYSLKLKIPLPKFKSGLLHTLSCCSNLPDLTLIVMLAACKTEPTINAFSYLYRIELRPFRGDTDKSAARRNSWWRTPLRARRPAGKAVPWIPEACSAACPRRRSASAPDSGPEWCVPPARWGCGRWIPLSMRWCNWVPGRRTRRLFGKWCPLRCRRWRSPGRMARQWSLGLKEVCRLVNVQS